MEQTLKEKVITSDGRVHERKERIKLWLKNPYQFAFLIIIIFSFSVNIYYFSLTKSQPLWWDEADYLAYAKKLAGMGNWTVTPGHLSLFSFIVALFFKLGFSESMIKFLVAFLPVVFVVPLVYLICNELYVDKRIALISAFLMAVFWEFLFYGQRFHLEAPGLLLGFLAIYTFIKGYQKNEKIFGKIHPRWALILTAIFIMLTFAMRLGYFLFGVFVAMYALFTINIKVLLRNKQIVTGITLGAFIIGGIVLWRFEAINSYISLHFGGLAALKIFKIYFENTIHPFYSVLLYLFWIGMVIVFGNLVIHLGYIKKTPNATLRGDVLAFTLIITTLSYFIFFQNTGQGFGDQRWYYPLLLGAFICIARASIVFADFLNKYNKILPLLFIILVLGYGGYYELQHANNIIKNKIPSYKGIKDAGLLVKEQSLPNDVVVAVSLPQVSYYSERKTVHPAELLNTTTENLTFDQFLNKIRFDNNVRYIIITFSEPGHPSWMRKETYAQDPATGQARYATWEIPFMNTTINFLTGEQDIKQSITYDDLTFTLFGIKEDAFVYQIQHKI